MPYRLTLICLTLLFPAMATATPPAKWAGRNARGTYRGTVESSNTLFSSAKPTTEPAIYRVQRRGDKLILRTVRPEGSSVVDAAGRRHVATTKTVGRIIQTNYHAPYDTTVLRVVFDDPRNLRGMQRLGDRVLAETGFSLRLKETSGTALLAFHPDGKLVVKAAEKMKLGALRPVSLGGALAWPLAELAKRFDLNHAPTIDSLFEGH